MQCEDALTEIIRIVDSVLGADDMSFDFHTTGNGGELVATIPAPIDFDTTLWQVAYSLLIPNLVAGDLLIASTDFEVTENGSGLVGVWHYLVLTDTPSGLFGLEICDRSGHNVTNNMHHGYFSRTAMHQAGTDMGDRYLNVVIYAKSVQGGLQPDLTLEQSYGRLNVTRLRNRSPSPTVAGLRVSTIALTGDYLEVVSR